MGPLFETLPRATLASIIVVALKGMFMQVKDLKRFINEGILETFEWIGTFLVVVIIDIDIGLLAGVIISILALYIKGLKSYSSMLGQFPNTDLYVDLKTHKNVQELQNIKIYRYHGSINFATCSSFKKNLFDKIGVNQRIIRRASLCETVSEARGFSTPIRSLIIGNARIFKINYSITFKKYIFVDLGSIGHIDMSGYRTFLEIRNEMKLLDIKTFLANASDPVYDSIKKATKNGLPSFEVFSSVHDAVLYAQSKIESS